MIGTGTYVVKDGDCIDSIAYEAGHFPSTLWDWPENAALKQLRKNPNVLLAGDKVFVPPLREKQAPCQTEKRHTFMLKGVPAKFRLQLMHGDKPRANEPYKLDIEDQSFTGTTDAQGWVEHSIPPNARKGTLTLQDGAEVYHLQLGHLDPCTEISGVQGRLKSMGFYDGDLDGAMSEELEEAICKFQASRNLEETGQVDEALSAALEDVHGS